MRAMEATRQQWVTDGERRTQARNDYWLACKVCSRTVGFERYPDGLVKKL